MVAGYIVTSFVRPDPMEIAASYPAERHDTGTAAPLREILRRPGVPAAIVAVVASFSVMASVMNLSGYVAIGRGHNEGDVFTMISVHIVGMYGLVLVVGGLIDRFGRRRALVAGLLVMAVSNAALASFGGVSGMSLALLGLGLGWNVSYVADLLIRAIDFTAAALALLGGLVYSGAGVTALALAAAALAGVPGLWLAARPRPVPLPVPD